MINLTKFNFQKLGVYIQHVTTGIIPSFAIDPTYMQNAEEIQVFACP